MEGRRFFFRGSHIFNFGSQYWSLFLKVVFGQLPSLKLTANAPENGWLEYDLSLSGQKAYFQVRGVSFREGNSMKTMH